MKNTFRLFLALALLAPLPAFAAEVDTITVLDSGSTPREVPTLLSVEARIGDVVDSPTTNTLLARLKVIGDKLLNTLAVTQSGTWNIGTVTTVASVTNLGTVTPGTAASSLGKAEDAAHASGDVGVLGLAVRNDDFTTFTSASGDNSPVAVTPSGQLLLTSAPHGAMVRGNASAISTTDTQVIAAQGASLRVYVKSCQVSNTGATNVGITFKDGAAGAVIGYTAAAANAGGSNIVYEVPIVTSVNTGLFFAGSAASNTVYVSCQGFKAP